MSLLQGKGRVVLELTSSMLGGHPAHQVTSSVSEHLFVWFVEMYILGVQMGVCVSTWIACVGVYIFVGTKAGRVYMFYAKCPLRGGNTMYNVKRSYYLIQCRESRTVEDRRPLPSPHWNS